MKNRSPNRPSGGKVTSVIMTIGVLFVGLAVSTSAQPGPATPNPIAARPLTANNARDIAKQWGISGVYFVVAPRKVTVLSGNMIRLDAELASPKGLALDGQTFDQGVWLNASADEAAFIAFGENVIPIEPERAIALIDQSDASTGTPGLGCGVSCKALGMYACCASAVGPNDDTCLCVPYADARICQAGGRGATACSISLGRR